MSSITKISQIEIDLIFLLDTYREDLPKFDSTLIRAIFKNVIKDIEEVLAKTQDG